jgi:hypothetical protein
MEQLFGRQTVRGLEGPIELRSIDLTLVETYYDVDFATAEK